MTNRKYQLVTNLQMMIFGIFVAVISSCSTIAMFVAQDHFSLPVVVQKNGQCMEVQNFKNGDAFTCPDVDVILRKYRIKIYQ